MKEELQVEKKKRIVNYRKVLLILGVLFLVCVIAVFGIDKYVKASTEK